VNGNLELRPRHGVGIDRDPDGFPSLVLAMVRESMEELGLEIDPVRVEFLGLGRLSYREEVGTNVLLASAMTGLTAKEIRDGMWRADATEGVWEIGSEIKVLPLPTGRKAARRLVAWALNSPELVPHARLAIVAASLAALGDPREEHLVQPLEDLNEVAARRRANVPSAREIGMRTLLVRDASSLTAAARATMRISPRGAIREHWESLGSAVRRRGGGPRRRTR
jgi:8-oxo-dGTP pyrophosphatase MutT (NUDIX family)